MKTKIIYTDGGCNPNPGHGGWAFAIDEIEFKSGGSDCTTNNIMELTAIVEAIKYSKKHYPDDNILIYSDSQYCVKGFMEWMHGWKRKGWTKKKGEIKNLGIWKELYSLKENVILEWVKGHNGNEMNEFVDELASNQVEF